MKKLVIFIFVVATIAACTNNDNQETELIGTWKLTEVLADPGDGSGTFHSVDSDKTLEFHPDGTVSCNGIICDMSIESNISSGGTYSLTDSTITPTDCQNSVITIQFEQTGSILVLYYPCIEPCKSKFVKI